MIVGDVRERLDSIGWVWLPASLNIAWRALANAFGVPIPGRLGREPIVELRPYSQSNAPKSSMSAIVGHSAQPMHTDAAYYPLPPRHVILSCIDAGESKCPTQLWVLNWTQLLHDRPSILTLPGWVAHGGRDSPFYCQILASTISGNNFVRFDPLCMKPPRSETDLRADVTEVLKSYSQEHSFLWNNGDILIFDNWRCLHARGPGSERAPSRRLIRWMGG